MRWDVSTLPAAVAAGNWALTTSPGGAMMVIGRRRPVLKGMSSSMSERKTYRTAEAVTAALALTPPRTWGDEPRKSTMAREPLMVTAARMRMGSPLMPSLSRTSVNR